MRKLLLLAVGLCAAGCGTAGPGPGVAPAGVASKAVALPQATPSPTNSTFTVNLNSGWNAVGFQTLTLTSINATAAASGLAFWNGTSYQVGSLTPAQVNAAGLRGFWVFGSAATSFTYTGNDGTGSRTLALTPGWNLAAFPSSAPVPASSLVAQSGGSVVNVSSVILPQFQAIGANNQYTPVNVTAPGAVLTPGTAYWVFASQAVTLSYGGTPQAQSITVPTSNYVAGNGTSTQIPKTAINCSIGGGPPVLAEIDTGSTALVVEQGFIGSGVTLTNVGVTLTYSPGVANTVRSGVLAFAPYSVLDNSGNPLITSVAMPILVVPNGVVSGTNSPNHAIFGVGTGGNVSPKLFLPPPYNQMLLINRPNNQLSFGTFPVEQFGTVPLSPSPASNPFTNPSPGPSPFGSPLPTPVGSPLLTYDDGSLPVMYTLGGTNPPTQTQIPTLIDTGEYSNFQSPTNTTPGITVSGINVTSAVNAVLQTTLGPLPLFFNQPIHYNVNPARSNVFCNMGSELVNHYTLLLDQAGGRLGLGNP